MPPSSTFHEGSLTHAAGFGRSQQALQFPPYPPSDIAAVYNHGVGRSSAATAGWPSGPDRVGSVESLSASVGAASYSGGSDPYGRETGHYGSGTGFAFGETRSGGGSGGRSSGARGVAGGPGAGGAGQGGGERVGGGAGSSRSRPRGDRGAGQRDEASRCQSPMSSCWFLLDEAQRFLDTVGLDTIGADTVGAGTLLFLVKVLYSTVVDHTLSIVLCAALCFTVALCSSFIPKSACLCCCLIKGDAQALHNRQIAK